MKWLEDQMRCRMNEMKKKMKIKKNWREERSDDCETAERKDTLMKMIIEEMSAIHTC
jgi:hypothetical protein